VPLAVRITGANVHDKWMAADVLDAVGLRAPRGPRRPEPLCLDKGYDLADAGAVVRRHYLAMVQLACGLIAYQQAHGF